MRIVYDGREIEMVERALFAETSWVERQAKLGFSEMTDSERTAAMWLVSFKRAGLHMTWADMMNTSPADFTVVEEPEPAEAEPVVPSTAGTEAGAGVSPALSTSDVTVTGC